MVEMHSMRTSVTQKLQGMKRKVQNKKRWKE